MASQFYCHKIGCNGRVSFAEIDISEPPFWAVGFKCYVCGNEREIKPSEKEEMKKEMRRD